MAEAVKVLVRCRPFNERERQLKCKVIVEMDGASGQVMLCQPDSQDMPPKAFTFDAAYFMDASSEQIYNDAVAPLVESVIEGYNGTVFAYGQTGSGKTFTMQGVPQPDTLRGVVPRAFEHLFEAIATTADFKFLVTVSYLEIYNEEVRDLLASDQGSTTRLEVKEHAERGIYVAGLSLHLCHSVADCQNLIDRGWNNRHVGATLMNKDSSRSHSIFTVHVEVMSKDGSIRKGKLNLVDLAGSERQGKTGATGDRLKEATKINLSLSALGNVISALVDGKATHIPYRDSKLTRLLQDSLGGNTRTLMVACISPASDNYDETLSTLRYANRAKNIKNKPKINEDPKDALLRQYQEEIARLKMMVQNPGAAAAMHEAGGGGMSASEVEEEKAKLRAEYETAMTELRTQYQEEQKSKSQLAADLDRLRQHYERAKEDIEKGGGGGQVDAVEAKRQLDQLEGVFVGGEQTNNEALKAKRAQRLKDAQRKTQRLAAALNVHRDDPLLQVYSSTQEKLDVVQGTLEKERRRTRALESEIEDLQGEFELDRLDYLDTIRKQDQQLKLLQQILDKLGPIVRRDTNYANLEKVKREAVWLDDEGRWLLPDVAMGRLPLPAAGVMTNGNGLAPSPIPSNVHPNGYASDGSEERLKKRLAAVEDPAAAYFKPLRISNRVVEKYKTDSNRTFESRTTLPKNYGGAAGVGGVMSKLNGLLNGVVYTDELYGMDMGAPRKPGRLGALPSRTA